MLKISKFKTYSTDFPVDLVYTWVNGSDPLWLKRKQSTERNLNRSSSKKVDDGRFLEIGEMKFSLRSVEKYLPWVNHIFIVTSNQTPNWLKISSKITIVDHHDIIDSRCLPTFNSCAIELNLHKIFGLSEHFIYLNDDIFFSQDMKKSHFFTPQGKPLIPVVSKSWKQLFIRHNFSKKLFLSNVKGGELIEGTELWELSKAFTLFEFYEKYNFYLNYDQAHIYMPATKEIFKLIWKNFLSSAQETSCSHFRNFQNINLQIMIILVGCVEKLSQPMIAKGKVRVIGLVPGFSNQLNHFIPEKVRSFCLNSGEKTTDQMRNHAFQFLTRIFPNRSHFENNLQLTSV